MKLSNKGNEYKIHKTGFPRVIEGSTSCYRLLSLHFSLNITWAKFHKACQQKKKIAKHRTLLLSKNRLSTQIVYIYHSCDWYTTHFLLSKGIFQAEFSAKQLYEIWHWMYTHREFASTVSFMFKAYPTRLNHTLSCLYFYSI